MWTLCFWLPEHVEVTGNLMGVTYTKTELRAYMVQVHGACEGTLFTCEDRKARKCCEIEMSRGSSHHRMSVGTAIGHRRQLS